MNMKWVAIFLFTFLCVAGIHGQSVSAVDAYAYTRIDYADLQDVTSSFDYKQTLEWKRHKIFKTCAFCSLGLGIGGMLVGVYGGLLNAYTTSDWEKKAKPWNIVCGVGAGLTVSSIPLFVLSYMNKRKAKESMRFSFVSSNIHLDLPNGMKQTQHAVGVVISF